MEFEIGDIVTRYEDIDKLLMVTGVIHDDGRLFVCDPSNILEGGYEFEISFDSVLNHYRKVKY